jgi:hypothetical protein
LVPEAPPDAGLRKMGALLGEPRCIVVESDRTGPAETGSGLCEPMIVEGTFVSK